jgi:exodeoxyribonuclease V alpha subunit
VVIPLTTSAWLMLQRNLLYTAVTRANGWWSWWAADALAKAVRTQGAGHRNTALTERLQQRQARTVAAVNRR